MARLSPLMLALCICSTWGLHMKDFTALHMKETDEMSQTPDTKFTKPTTTQACKMEDGPGSDFHKAVVAASDITTADTTVSRTSSRSMSLSEKDCLDPSTADPESWSCECADKMREECNGVDEVCFKRLLCGHADVCQTWKTEASCSASESSFADVMVRRAKKAEKQKVTLDSSGGLDGAVSGKCSQ